MDKDKIARIAEEISAKEHDCTFVELPEKDKHDVWCKAEIQYQEGLQDQADNLRKEMELHELGVVSEKRKEDR